MATALRMVMRNRNVMAISMTNMLYNVFNQLWMMWWGLYLVEVLNTPIVVVGLLSTIQTTGSILFMLPGGLITDKYGRKKIIVYGTALRVIAPIFLFTARSWHWVVPGIILNATASIYMPAFNAIIADSMPKEGRGTAFGAYRMFTSLPSIFMPVAAGYFFDLLGLDQGMKIGLMMFTVAAGIAVVIRARYLEETLERPKAVAAVAPGEKRGILEDFKSQPRMVYSMLTVSIVSAFFMRMSWSFLPIYAYSRMGLSTTQYGLLQSIAAGIATPLYMIGGMVADRYGRVPFILLGRGLGNLDTLSMLFLRDYNQLMAVFGAVGLIEGISGDRIRGGGFMGGPAWEALMADIVAQKDRGKVGGMMGTITGLVTLPAPYIGGFVYAANPDLLLLLTAAQFLVIPIILLFFKEPRKQQLVTLTHD